MSELTEIDWWEEKILAIQAKFASRQALPGLNCINRMRTLRRQIQLVETPNTFRISAEIADKKTPDACDRSPES